MAKVTGIKSVDFKITAYGHGVVNWNGSTTVKGSDGLDINNHSMPKLRGYSNLTGVESEKGHKFKKEATDVNFSDTPLYISQNCIRHHLFRDQAFDLHFAKTIEDVKDLLASVTGLIRGYVVTIKGSPIQPKRTSALLLEDFVEKWGNGNFEVMSRSGTKEKEENKKRQMKSDSFFTKTTFGDTKYEAYGSISIEQLQFISLSPNFDRCAMPIADNDGGKFAKQIQDFIKTLDPSREPKATFHPNFVRKGTIYKQGEAGILLDDVAIDILVKTTLDMIENLAIRQAKGYMYVDEVEVDYNSSNKMMRIKPTRSPNDVVTTKQEPYAVYFQAE
ncbi:type I-Fv CRISPR-associated protein Cas7fv [Kingella negevensis]|uniref:Uncharacterized protein n=1 Tax=Kingella negevensis TaxID=1522312 RepID=A0A238TDN2_9NEIS|nr:type I-Fv CRISPR-associated protein Cas7fv [Kingella negevensis]MDK4685587.1 type I-Fv CRISPR-associated protein Cas7fv [Kingella negevensis]MDK4698362.1 type I-Fv CRISPR-associated protein Cas7fv [Kingella negevensis]MDK4706854.1 type I-Fv CRISPR-associated protein Cas7fv [Kingella negevensis]MDK4710435.1 type I-Fv CRISPR-associated protein Cas7fv [Kingella negevensis]WII93385.1 type I-Fv CRISPR-associated protein Cas7fv [Kingella negevensis]